MRAHKPITHTPRPLVSLPQGVPAVEHVLVPRLKEILINEFGAVEKAPAATA